jgi:thiamine kinase-like enzyme
MDITIDNVVPYLLHRGFLDTESIVNNHLKIVDVSKKNRNLKVIRNSGMSYLLKQPNLTSHNGRISIRREARLYSLSEEEYKSICASIPHILKFEPRLDLLITELIKNAKPLNECIYDDLTSEYSNVLAATLGRVMATYHRAFTNHQHSHMLSFLPKTLPSSFYMLHPGPKMLSQLNPASLKLFKLIQKHSKVSDLFKSLVDNWRVQTLIHGDIRWDNMLLLSSNNHNQSIQIKLVDWEFADLGDAAWDVGSVFHEFITFWMYSLHIKGTETIEQLLTQSQLPLSQIQTAVRVFWQAYTTVSEIDDLEANELLYRSTKYCAVRLLQTVYEASYGDEIYLSNISLYLIQLSTNILNDVDSAITYLLGIPLKCHVPQ